MIIIFWCLGPEAEFLSVIQLWCLNFKHDENNYLNSPQQFLC